MRGRGLAALCALALLIAPAGVFGEEDAGGRLTPGEGKCGKSGCYWETPMDIRDEAAVWAMLTAPITVVDGEQTEQAVLYAEPSEDAEAVADVTCYSQGVHVLDTLSDGWSLVECYSSSFHDSKIKAWNQLSRGYIKTGRLTVREVKNTYGIIVDKMTQRLYVFKEGALYDVLKVSTGLINDEQPFNETRSGEFILCSRTGAFASGNLTCGLAIRFNAGDLLHEVPHKQREGGKKDYSFCEPQLGQRASHGCIRVQRLRTSKGLNMQWIWDTMKKELGTRIVIWEDWKGRELPYPDDQSQVYYNPNKGKNYHAAETCYSVKDEFLPLAAFSYWELDLESYAGLTPCDYCNPPLRHAEIDEINRLYAQ